MNGTPVSQNEIDEMIRLRKIGHSITQIKNQTGRGMATIVRYVKNTPIPYECEKIHKYNMGGSKKRSALAWEKARNQAKSLIDSNLTKEQRLCLLVALYWGEGTKRELNILNSDPALLKVFVECLKDIGVNSESLKISLRLFENINKNEAIHFWAAVLEIEPKSIQSVEIIHGIKVGKLKYGMCRVRVAKSGPYFKLIMSLIDLIKTQFNAAVVQRIEQGTPKP